jgi:hypothetical protein
MRRPNGHPRLSCKDGEGIMLVIDTEVLAEFKRGLEWLGKSSSIQQNHRALLSGGLLDG